MFGELDLDPLKITINASLKIVTVTKYLYKPSRESTAYI